MIVLTRLPVLALKALVLGQSCCKSHFCGFGGHWNSWRGASSCPTLFQLQCKGKNTLKWRSSAKLPAGMSELLCFGAKANLELTIVGQWLGLPIFVILCWMTPNRVAEHPVTALCKGSRVHYSTGPSFAPCPPLSFLSITDDRCQAGPLWAHWTPETAGSPSLGDARNTTESGTSWTLVDVSPAMSSGLWTWGFLRCLPRQAELFHGSAMPCQTHGSNDLRSHDGAAASLVQSPKLSAQTQLWVFLFAFLLLNNCRFRWTLHVSPLLNSLWSDT